MPRLQPGFTVTEQGVVGPEQAQAVAQVIAGTLGRIMSVPAEEPLRGSTTLLEAILETHPDLEVADDPDIAEDIQLVMATKGYSEEEARYFKERVKYWLDAGMMHSQAVLEAESEVYDRQAEACRQTYLVGAKDAPLAPMCESVDPNEGPDVSSDVTARLYVPENYDKPSHRTPPASSDVTMSVDVGESQPDEPVYVPQEYEPGSQAAAAVMERVKRRRGEEKLVHVSTALPQEIKDWLVQQGSYRQMKLGAYVRVLLEQAYSMR